jgi:putative membrane protein insertion efficiency factor
MQLSDRLNALHFYTETDSGLVQFGNVVRPRARQVMWENDGVIKDTIIFYSRFALQCAGTKFHGMEPDHTARPTPARRMSRLPRIVGRGLVRLYRATLSPLVGYDCRYLPTCSDYADQALARHGLWAGGWMTLARLLRCHPWGNSGLDFVPNVPPPDARWYLPWRYGRWRGTNSGP